jgi:hypothetical protein
MTSSIFGGAITNVGFAPSAFAFSNNTAGTVHAPQGVITKTDEVNMADLESLPFNTPIETLLNLWVARYGNEWVDVTDVLAEEFYGLTYKRLKSLGKLETHYLTNKSRFVCRKPI